VRLPRTGDFGWLRGHEVLPRIATGGHEGVDQLVQQRKSELLQIEHVEHGLVAGVPRGHLPHPPGHLPAVPARAGAADDDANHDHRGFSCSDSCALSLSSPGFC
jgi:hypothetical protein